MAPACATASRSRQQPPVPSRRSWLQRPDYSSNTPRKVSAPGAGERSQDTPKAVEMSRAGVLPASKAIRRVTAEPVPAVLGLGGSGGGGVGGRALQAPAQLSVETAGGVVEGLGQAAGEP